MQLKCKKKKRKICEVYEKVLDGSNVSKVFAKFCAGDFFLGASSRVGRPVEVDSEQVETLIENNQHYTVWEIADILKISKSIQLLVKMKMCLLFYRRKPHELFG